MKKNEIKIGSTYAAKITNRVVPVRIDATNPHGGWDATNLVTKKKVRIKSAAKLRGVYRDGAKADPATKVATKTPTTKATRANTAATVTKAKAKATTEAKPAKAATRAKDAKRGSDKARKHVGILDAAAHILAETGGTMSCKAIVNIAIESGVWKTSGKTPAATLYAAMTREITKKGKDARFRKVDRGLFVAAGKEA
jgi:hypothetical protein